MPTWRALRNTPPRCSATSPRLKLSISQNRRRRSEAARAHKRAPREKPAVDHNALASDELGGVRYAERDRIGDVGGLARPAKWDQPDHLLLVGRRYLIFAHLDESRCYGVDADAMWPKLLRHRLRQHDNTCFGGAVMRRSNARRKARGRGESDNRATTTRCHALASERLAAKERSFEIHVQHPVPGCFWHF